MRKTKPKPKLAEGSSLGRDVSRETLDIDSFVFLVIRLLLEEKVPCKDG
jgi:hypothetical protein